MFELLTGRYVTCYFLVRFVVSRSIRSILVTDSSLYTYFVKMMIGCSYEVFREMVFC